MNKAWEDVREFHFAFNHPVAVKPGIIDHRRTLARADWMQEEINEFIAAKSLTEQADAMVDLIYFALGTLVEMGIKPQKLFDIVQEANMSKLWPDGKPRYRDDGKILKPVSWIAPEPRLIKEIERQIEEATK